VVKRQRAGSAAMVTLHTGDRCAPAELERPAAVVDELGRDPVDVAPQRVDPPHPAPTPVQPAIAPSMETSPRRSMPAPRDEDDELPALDTFDWELSYGAGRDVGEDDDE
jgi:hypothetical protein